ncbi:MAG: acyl-CoA dehydrogenase family protein [Acidimicrobiia bacterium]
MGTTLTDTPSGTGPSPQLGAGHRHHEVVEAARALGPAIAAAADEIERLGRLPDALVEQLRAARVFDLYAPAAVGGLEVDPLTAFSVTEELSRHDGSVGWCTQVAAATTVFLAWIDPAAVAEMTALGGGRLHIAGSARALGQARMVEGGYLASGHWNYASGVRHANWFLGTCVVERPDGRRSPRSMFMPVTDGTIVSNWNVLGMRGTGSDDFVLDEVFVPAGRAAERRWIEVNRAPLYDQRLNMVAAWAPTAGVGVGLAQGAVDALVALGAQATAGSEVPLREREAVHDAAGRAATMVGAARAFVLGALGHAWQQILERPHGSPDATVTRAVTEAQLAITHALNEAVRVADTAFHAAGTAAISSANRLERILRDAHTAVQHAAGQPIHVRAGGRVVMGLDAGKVDLSRTGPVTPRP